MRSEMSWNEVSHLLKEKQAGGEDSCSKELPEQGRNPPAPANVWDY